MLTTEIAALLLVSLYRLSSSNKFLFCSLIARILTLIFPAVAHAKSQWFYLTPTFISSSFIIVNDSAFITFCSSFLLSSAIGVAVIASAAHGSFAKTSPKVFKAFYAESDRTVNQTYFNTPVLVCPFCRLHRK